MGGKNQDLGLGEAQRRRVAVDIGNGRMSFSEGGRSPGTLHSWSETMHGVGATTESLMEKWFKPRCDRGFPRGSALRGSGGGGEAFQPVEGPGAADIRSIWSRHLLSAQQAPDGELCVVLS